MTSLSIELDDRVESRTCGGCGGEAVNVRGYVYVNGDAFAVYFAELYPGHVDRKIALDITVGDWDEGSPPESRSRIGMVIRQEGAEYQISVSGPVGWPWGASGNFGRLMTRDEALSHPDLKRFYEVAELIIENDSRVNGCLEGKLR